MTQNNPTIEVHFTHPRDSRHFTADVELRCTGQQAIQGLLLGDENGPFLDPAPQGRPYELVLDRTGRQITPNMTFADAGVAHGDVIQIRQAGQGA